MTAKEALGKIMKDTPDGSIWYKVSSDYDDVNRLRATALRIEQGEYKMQLNTLKEFFSQFGYEVEINVKPKTK